MVFANGARASSQTIPVHAPSADSSATSLYTSATLQGMNMTQRTAEWPQ